MGVSGGKDLHTHAPPATFRERSRPTHGRSPVWRRGLHARTHTLTRCSQCPENDRERTPGRSPVWRADLHTHASLATPRERSRAHAWAKPCLAGRPTVLVRTQPPETNTSRGRPSGMELPDYPVMATLPTPWDQDGPALPLPARSFPVLVPRYASRRSTFPRFVTRSASRRPSLRRACAQSHPYRDRRYRGFR
jgi:hypothetical protein